MKKVDLSIAKSRSESDQSEISPKSTITSSRSTTDDTGLFPNTMREAHKKQKPFISQEMKSSVTSKQREKVTQQLTPLKSLPLEHMKNRERQETNDEHYPSLITTPVTALSPTTKLQNTHPQSNSKCFSPLCKEEDCNELTNYGTSRLLTTYRGMNPSASRCTSTPIKTDGNGENQEICYTPSTEPMESPKDADCDISPRPNIPSTMYSNMDNANEKGTEDTQCTMDDVTCSSSKTVSKSVPITYSAQSTNQRVVETLINGNSNSNLSERNVLQTVYDRLAALPNRSSVTDSDLHLSGLPFLTPLDSELSSLESLCVERVKPGVTPVHPHDVEEPERYSTPQNTVQSTIASEEFIEGEGNDTIVYVTSDM